MPLSSTPSDTHPWPHIAKATALTATPHLLYPSPVPIADWPEYCRVARFELLCLFSLFTELGL